MKFELDVIAGVLEPKGADNRFFIILPTEETPDCCQSLHDFASKSHTSDQVARARFAAYSLGIPQYLIASTHPSQKDYVRHTESNKDMKKAMKSWQKEIVSKNTDIYEFLLFDLLSNGTSISTAATQ
eukprot:gene39850-52598_t